MRSLLFVSGDDERRIVKGLGCAADALILGLEDAVAPACKEAARRICVKALLRSADAAKKLFVRVNGSIPVKRSPITRRSRGAGPAESCFRSAAAPKI